MNLIDTSINDVKIVSPRVFEDSRGFFLETWNDKVFAALGIDNKFVQDNHSRSCKGTLRGLHYQVRHTQGKLVRILRGDVYDVAVDLRRASPTFGKHVGVRLSDTNKRMLWVPPGFAHGFIVLSESADYSYKCTDYYAPEFERCLLWNDPVLGIDWQLSALEMEAPLLSDKDRQGVLLQHCEVFL